MSGYDTISGTKSGLIFTITFEGRSAEDVAEITHAAIAANTLPEKTDGYAIVWTERTDDYPDGRKYAACGYYRVEDAISEINDWWDGYEGAVSASVVARHAIPTGIEVFE